MIPEEVNAHHSAILLLSLANQLYSSFRSYLNVTSSRKFPLTPAYIESADTHSHSALSSVFCSIHLKWKFILLYPLRQTLNFIKTRPSLSCPSLYPQLPPGT